MFEQGKQNIVPHKSRGVVLASAFMLEKTIKQ